MEHVTCYPSARTGPPPPPLSSLQDREWLVTPLMQVGWQTPKKTLCEEGKGQGRRQGRRRGSRSKERNWAAVKAARPQPAWHESQWGPYPLTLEGSTTLAHLPWLGPGDTKGRTLSWP